MFSMGMWIVWAAVLILQNFSFTFVSRARNSASLSRHMVAAFLSNIVWFAGQLIIVDRASSLLKGDHGVSTAVFTALFYTAFTCLGSLAAHAWALRTEQGKSAVGFSRKYAQITTEEWTRAKERLDL